VRDIASVSDTFMQLLSNKMGEIFDPAQSLTPTDDRKRCDTCPYAAICGR